MKNKKNDYSKNNENNEKNDYSKSNENCNNGRSDWIEITFKLIIANIRVVAP